MIRDHQRAVLAERHVRGVSTWDDAKARTAYGAICMKLPILVHQAGLAPALHHVAQLSSSGKHDILDHLGAQLHACGLVEQPTASFLLERTREADTTALLATTREVLRCLEWYRRFAKTILKVEPGEDA